MSSSRSDRIIELLRRLEQLKNQGILSEEEYRIKREKLINALLSEEEHEVFVRSEGKKPSKKPTLLAIGIVILMLVVIFGIIAYSLAYYNSLRYTSTNPGTIYIITQTVTQPPPAYYHTDTVIQPQYPAPSIVRTVYSGSLYIERDCSTRRFEVQAKKGDVIRVYWEANDDDTYVAIGSPADLERLGQSYCEVVVSFWKWSWPAAGSGYSGSLEFRVPSSGTWHVIVANGNWECIFTKCPITVTVLDIKHESR